MMNRSKAEGKTAAALLVAQRQEAILITLQKINTAVCNAEPTWCGASDLEHVLTNLTEIAEFLNA